MCHLRHAAVFIFLACFLSNCAIAKKQSDEAKKKGETKLQWMLEQTANDPIVTLTSRTFKTYINGGPRPYSVVVAFTALHASNQCQACQELHKEFEKVAKSYADSRSSESHNLFFAEVDYNSNTEIFAELQMTNAPLVILIPSSDSAKSHSVSTLFTRYPRRWQYVVQQGFQGITDWVTKMTGIDASTARNFTTKELMIAVAVVAAVILILWFFGFYIYEKLKNVWLFIIIAVMVYLFNISGGMFNIIRETQWSLDNYKGSTQYIHPQARMQFKAEGYMMGLAYFGCSLCCLILIYSQKQPKGGTRRKCPALLLDYCPAVIVVGAFIAAYWSILHVYSMKNPSYNYGNVGFFG